MLSDAKLQSIICTSRINEAERFYSDTLGLPLTGKSHGALLYDVGGSVLRVSPVPSTQPSAHTVLGFAVRDLSGVMICLALRHVIWERFPGFNHDALGAITTPDGAKVAWLRDPDGNLLSVVEFLSD